jgi:hypothetical protein
MNPRNVISRVSPLRRQVAGGLLAGALVLAVPSLAAASAGASPAGNADIKTTVSSLKAAGAADVSTVAQKCEQGITARQTQIDNLNNHMAQAKLLAPDHKSQLSGDLSSASSGLSSLNGQIGSATTLKALFPLCLDIVDNFRIYVLQTPRTDLTIGADAETSVIAKLQGISPKLEAAIKAAQAAGKDVGNAPSLYSDFTAKLADASSKATGAADQVLPLTVAEYNAGTAKPVLQTTYQNLVLGHGDLIAARQDAVQIVQILKGLDTH